MDPSRRKFRLYFLKRLRFAHLPFSHQVMSLLESYPGHEVNFYYTGRQTPVACLALIAYPVNKPLVFQLQMRSPSYRNGKGLFTNHSLQFYVGSCI